jgi:hypothetical protein
MNVDTNADDIMQEAKFHGIASEMKLFHDLEITGPLIDNCLREIGRAFWSKIGGSKSTGLMPPIKVFIP